jgi:hypothetical protein
LNGDGGTVNIRKIFYKEAQAETASTNEGPTGNKKRE